MVKRMHKALRNALTLAQRPDGWRVLAHATSRSPVGARPAYGDPRGGSLISVLNRQIADAQLRLRGLSDPLEREAQVRLIAELRKHQKLEFEPQAACA